MLKTMFKKMVSFSGILVLVLLAYGVCLAEEPLVFEEAIPITPYGETDPEIIVYEWTSVPGATLYYVLVENMDGNPVHLARYTSEAAGCGNGEALCWVMPRGILYVGDAWYVLPCSGDQCGIWSEAAPIELKVSTYSGPAKEGKGPTIVWHSVTTHTVVVCRTARN